MCCCVLGGLSETNGCVPVWRFRGFNIKVLCCLIHRAMSAFSKTKDRCPSKVSAAGESFWAIILHME